MRQVMIVDDERWIRRGLIQSIPWEELGLALAGEAEDGEDAYHMALLKKPDLLFLDMRMPGLDGKQLLALLGKELPELLTIVVSGYSDFEYTKEAIRHKAFDYLLKPIKKDELAAVLGKALTELDRRETSEAREREGSAKNWLENILFTGDGSEGIVPAAKNGLPDGRSWKAGNTLLLVAQPDVYVERCELPLVMEQLRQKLQQERAFYFGGEWDVVMTAAPGSSCELVLCLHGNHLVRSELLRLLAMLQPLLKHMTGVSYSIAASEQEEQHSLLPQLYKKAKLSLNGRKLGEAGWIGFAGETAVVAAAAFPRELEQALLINLQHGNEEQAQQDFERFYEQISQPCMTVDDLLRGALMLVHSLEKQLQSAGTNLEKATGHSLLAYTEMIRLRRNVAAVGAIFTDEILPGVIGSRGPAAGKQGEQIVREIQKLIEQHYDQPLSLHQIAESRFLNADYLSRLFKKTTGSNFVDYLTDARIAKAVELMGYPAYKNYEIAKRVGYEDYRYFSQIFKKKMGMTIGDYRSSLEPQISN
ncbi:response regulator transcription factor [Paenibacillus luteus]|uniref:response regulator transcription factor n=1 Tax=Paenibacillus luteus TaxID=2545753 RepID=UPI0011430701|nr:response regulator [Paenibacillus luteus]